MREYHGQAGKRHKFQTPDRPAGLPHKSCAASLELVYVSPDEFLRLERLGKHRRRPVTLPVFSFSGA